MSVILPSVELDNGSREKSSELAISSQMNLPNCCHAHETTRESDFGREVLSFDIRFVAAETLWRVYRVEGNHKCIMVAAMACDRNFLLILYMRFGAEVGAELGGFRCSSGWVWGLKWMWVLGAEMAWFGSRRGWLSAVKGLFEKPSELRKHKSRYDIYKRIDGSYYAYRDDEDEVLEKVERGCGVEGEGVVTGIFFEDDDVVMEERMEREREMQEEKENEFEEEGVLDQLGFAFWAKNGLCVSIVPVMRLGFKRNNVECKDLCHKVTTYACEYLKKGLCGSVSTVRSLYLSLVKPIIVSLHPFAATLSPRTYLGGSLRFTGTRRLFSPNVDFYENSQFLRNESGSMHLGVSGDVSRRIAKIQRGEFSQRYMVKSNDMLPQKLDWRESVAVTPISRKLLYNFSF
ncbi:pre-mRNA-splicing factor ISY1 [Tanacetum coccineum]